MKYKISNKIVHAGNSELVNDLNLKGIRTITRIIY